MATSSADVVARAALVERLRAQLRGLGGGGRANAGEVLSTGFAPLDGLLPARGLPRGTLSEWLSAETGQGAATLALGVALGALRISRHPLVVIDPGQGFYPPGAAGQGLDLARLILVRPSGADDTLWAWEQVLRCRSVAAVWGWLERLDQQAFRRLQLAAETGRTWGFLLRPAAARTTASWAEVRLGVQALASPSPAVGVGPRGLWLAGPAPAGTWPGDRRLRVELLRGRSALLGRSVTIDLYDPRRLEPAAEPATGAAGAPTVARA